METKKCTYCGAVRPESEMVQRNLVYREQDKKGHVHIKKILKWYCADTACDERHQDKEDNR